jgi:hypothetical protein
VEGLTHGHDSWQGKFYERRAVCHHFCPECENHGAITTG